MKVSEAGRLIGIRRPDTDLTRRRLRRCHSIEDLRRAARRVTPRPVFDYVDGGAESELTLAENSEAFARWRFAPLCLRDVSSCDTSGELLGSRFDLPLLLAPTGLTRMMHRDGEHGVAAAAETANLPYALSTMGTTSITDLARSGHPHLWFQLYVWRDRGFAFELVERALAEDYDALELCVDVPVLGFRARDARNGLTIPPRLTPRALADIASHPRYWLAALRSPMLGLPNSAPGASDKGVLPDMSTHLDSSLDWSVVAEIRRRWPRPLLLKGPISSEDARRAIELGVDGIHLSNHGGRQLDRCLPSIETVRETRREIGDSHLLIVDSGIRSGADLATAICLGADCGAIGRAYLFGLMAGGQAGVEHALQLIGTEFRRTMQLLGVSSVAELRELGPRLLSQK